jgi:hypothetical protein
MRSRSSRLTMSTSAAMLSGLVALASIHPAFAQGAGKPAQPAAAAPAKPATAAPAQPAAAAAAKPAAAAAAKPAAAAPAQPAGAAKPATPGQPSAGAAKPAKPLTEKQKKDEAKKLYKDAEAKFDSGDYAGALPLYQEADKLIPGAPPKYKIATCHDKIAQAPGATPAQVTEAMAAWQAYLDAKPDPEKFKDKITEAQGRIEGLKKTPAKVKVATVPENPPNLRIAVNDVPQASKDLSIPPGHHKITVTADGYAPATQEIDVTFAESRDLSVPLTEQAPPPAAAAPPPPIEPPAAPATPPPEPRSPVPAYVTLGLAGVGAVVGTIFGIQALSSKSDFEDDPTTDNADTVDRNALISDMSFAVALTFGVTGAVLLLSSDAPAEQPAAAAAHPKPVKPIKKAVVAPFVGPTGGGAAARFTF